MRFQLALFAIVVAFLAACVVSPADAQVTRRPTRAPSKRPSKAPSQMPSKRPSQTPSTRFPTRLPTRRPTLGTRSPSNIPSRRPSAFPTKRPTKLPTRMPSKRPTPLVGTRSPTTKVPSLFPTLAPTAPTMSNVFFQQSAGFVAASVRDDVSADFGRSCDFSRDTAFITAPGYGDYSGAVFAFTNVNGVWTESPNNITAPDGWCVPAEGYAGCLMGSALAVSQDGKTVLAGAPYHTTSSQQTGAVFHFERNATGQYVATNLIVPDLVDWLSFGFSVAISADGQTAVVGTPDANERGGGYALKRNGASWTLQKLTFSVTLALYSNIGVSAAISGDGNYIILGGYQAEGTDAGSVYVFFKNQVSGNFAQQARLTGFQLFSNFGISVALDAAGLYAAVGADSQDDMKGAAFLYRRVGTTWSLVNKVTPGPDYIYFGANVALSEDGVTAIVASGSEPGAFQVFRRALAAGPFARVGTDRIGSETNDFDYFLTCLATSNGTLLTAVNGGSVTGRAYTWV